MSIIVRSAPADPVIKTGFGINIPSDPLANSYHYNSAIARSDPFLAELAGFDYFIPAFAAPVGSVFGVDLGTAVSDDVYVSSKPLPIIPLDTYDVQLYGSNAANLATFLSLLSGSPVKVPSSIKEHAIRHYSYSGELIESQSDVPSHVGDYTFMGYPYKALTHDVLPDTLRVNTVVPVDVVVLTRDYAVYYARNFLDLIRSFVGKETGEVIYLAPYTVIREISRVQYVLTHERLVLSYHVRANQLLDYVYEWDSELVFEFRYQPRNVIPSDGLEVYYAAVRAPVTIRYTNATFNGVDDGIMGETSGSRTIVNSVALALSSAQPHSGAAHDVYLGVPAQLRARKFLDVFRRDIERDFAQIIPSIMFSSAEAFNDARNGIDTDIFQTLAKIPNIGAAVPKFREAISLLGHLAKRDLSLATLREILDLATSTDLQAMFVWRPYISLFSTLIPQMVSILTACSSHTVRTSIGYGSFRHTLLNEYGRESITLLTRTKLVIDLSPSGLLSTILRIDSLGILPKPSNVWDTMPFTFVVNWFTGVTGSMKRAERSLELLTIPAYFVHTFTITSPLLADELEILKASSSSPEPASLKLYFRDITLYCPTPKDSRLGFGLPSGLPSLGTLGSLLYQLLFSR